MFDQEMGSALGTDTIVPDGALVISLYDNRETFTVSCKGIHTGISGVPSENTSVLGAAKISVPGNTGMSKSNAEAESEGRCTDSDILLIPHVCFHGQGAYTS